MAAQLARRAHIGTRSPLRFALSTPTSRPNLRAHRSPRANNYKYNRCTNPMSYGSAGAAAVQDRLRVEYAPTDRASCKSCGTGMPKGSVKLGEKVRSPWHDGWDIKFCKVKCAIHKANGMPHEISHLQKLKWKDQVEIVEMMGKTVEKGAATEALKARSDKLYALIEVLQGMTKANIKELCEANGSQVHGDKAAPPDMAYTAADGLLYGKLGECPWCKSEALQQEGNLVRCMGYLTAGTRCTYSICEGPLFGSAPCTKVGALPSAARRGC